MNFRILKAADHGDRLTWEAAWRNLPDDRRDVYFLPAYLLAMQADGRGEACCAIAVEGDAQWLYPFLKCPIKVPDGTQIGAGLFDIQSAYGYGGPVVNRAGGDDQFLAAAWQGFSEWCAGAGVVGEFCRFHPLIDNHRWAANAMTVEDNRKTVAVDLGTYPDAVWKDPYFKTHRNMIRKADRAGYKFRVMAPVSTGILSWFVPMYARTHENLGGRDETNFGAVYFESLIRGLRERAWIVTAKRGLVEAAVLVMEGAEFAHCHVLGYEEGSRGSGGVSNCLLHGAALEAASRGLKLLHLGGGTSGSDEDPLLLFKTKMSPWHRTFRIGTRCHDKACYERLASRWEERNGPRPKGHFLFYRLSVDEAPTARQGSGR